jgi:hypothetical protein
LRSFVSRGSQQCPRGSSSASAQIAHLDRHAAIMTPALGSPKSILWE